MKRNYKGYLYVIGYLMLLRVALHITTGISVFSFGILFDLVLMMFWVGVIAFFIKKQRYQKTYYIVVMLIATVFVVGDSIYHDYFDIISSKTSLAGIELLQAGQTLEYNLTIPLVAYIVTPIFIFFIYLIISNKKRDVFLLSDFRYLSIIFVVQTAIFLYWGSHEFETKLDYYRSDAYLFESMYDRSTFSEKYGYFNYHILDIVRIRTSRDREELIEEVDLFFRELDTHVTNDYSDTYNGYNLITITAETLDVRFIDETLTPNLYMMQENGYSFSNYFTPVFQQGATCNSEYMALTGLNAISSNDWSNNICETYVDNLFPYSLPSQLQQEGYHTYYFHSGYEWFYNRDLIIPHYGFKTVKFQEDIYELDYDNPTKEDYDGSTPFVDKYDTNMLYFFDEFVDFDELFHINLLTYSMHGAYNQQELYPYEVRVEQAYPNNEFDEEILSYMEKLVEFDEMLGDLLDRLETEGVLDNTLIAIYPDHSIYMMDRTTYLDHLGIDVEEHAYELHRQNLILYSTNMEKTVFDVPGSTIDIAPTLLNMLDSSLSFDYFMGTDLLGTDTNYVIFSDLTITDGSSYLTIKEKVYGEPIDLATFEAALSHEIEALDIQKSLLNSEYFNDLEED